MIDKASRLSLFELCCYSITGEDIQKEQNIVHHHGATRNTKSDVSDKAHF